MRQSTYTQRGRLGLQFDAVGKASDAILKVADGRASASGFALERREFVAKFSKLVGRISRSGGFENTGTFAAFNADTTLTFEGPHRGLRRVQRHSMRGHQVTVGRKVLVNRVHARFDVAPKRVSYALASWTVCGFIGHLSSHANSLPLS